jgi:hypothetical protein
VAFAGNSCGERVAIGAMPLCRFCSGRSQRRVHEHDVHPSVGFAEQNLSLWVRLTVYLRVEGKKIKCFINDVSIEGRTHL